MGKILVSLLVMMLLAGCAHAPTMYATDGSSLVGLEKDRFTYRLADGSTTQCGYDAGRQLTVCDNGRASPMTVAGLPLHGLVAVQFDGRSFRREAEGK